MVIDLQVHFWEEHSSTRPHLDIAVPNLPNPFGPSEMKPIMEQDGVEHVVIVPPGFMGNNNDYALECSLSFPKDFSVMGLVDITDENLSSKLENWFDQKGMIGIRTHVSKRMRDRWPNEKSANILWELCSKFDIPVATFASGEAQYLRNVLKDFPKLKLVIDHFGLPPIDDTRAAGINKRFLEDILSLSEFPNAFIKTSTLPVRSKQVFPYKDMHEVIKLTFNAFGANRMLWATDFTQSLARNGSSYQEELGLWQNTLPFLNDNDIELILHENALSVFSHLSLD